MSLGEHLEQRWYLDGHEVRDGAELEVRIGDGSWRRVRLVQRKVKVEGWFPATMWVAYGLLDDPEEEVPISPEVEFRWSETPGAGPPAGRTPAPETPDLDELLGRLGKGFFDEEDEDDEDEDDEDEDDENWVEN